jgi:hypothetical protein
MEARNINICMFRGDGGSGGRLCTCEANEGVVLRATLCWYKSAFFRLRVLVGHRSSTMKGCCRHGKGCFRMLESIYLGG